MNVEKKHKVLMVDDEPNILESFKRDLRGQVDLTTAMNGKEALMIMEGHGPFAVVVSDYKMPVMDGVEFLSRVKEIYPETVRIMLTGYADVESAIRAVNNGNIFQFLTKPCPTESLLSALKLATRQYELVKAEKELLEQTLRGSITVLTELLSLARPGALGRASRIIHYLKEIVRAEQIENAWELETAAVLSQVGCVSLDRSIVEKAASGKSMTKEERAEFLKHPGLGAAMLSNIPRMQGVSRIIAYQEKNYDGSGVPEDSVAQDDIPLGSRILKVLLHFDSLVSGGMSKGKALEVLKGVKGVYDPEVLETLDAVLGKEGRYDIKEVSVQELDESMIVAQDVVDLRGNRTLLLEGQPLSKVYIMNLQTIDRIVGVGQPIKVLVPLN